ncbi:type I-E CRISPR-associated protein Cas5/CasD [Streptomyces sp. NPDC051569]|uniref:type I-E CRISPR-associated protein Cas5/CasD n=1 Tax=Streptomyces sp. NPDC051569 TaxID=3365661 RepID=UPI0037A6E65B
MSVLTLCLAGPLQSWGSAARFVRRTTESAPTKSGVLGMLAAAQGLARGDDEGLARLGALRFGVRIDQPGTRVRDFQTAHHAVTGKSMPLSERFYLADAVFVAAVEGERAFIDDLHSALRTPVHPVFLGRRSCPPARPVELGVHHDDDLEQALRAEPWQASAWYQQLRRRHGTVPLVIMREPRPDEPAELADTLRDQPLSFAAEQRKHALRSVLRTSVDVPNPQARAATTSATTQAVPEHDVFGALEEEDT